jgi:hypothetical protein
VLLSGSAAVAAPDPYLSVQQPDIVKAPATPAAIDQAFSFAEWTAYETDDAAPSADSTSGGADCNDCTSCDCNGGACCECGRGMSDWWNCPIQPSNHCFDDFISPITNPVFFEDPRTLSEARFIFLNHKVPLAAGGGDVQLYALQIRAALSDRLSLIATKDGYIVSQNPLIEDGWADVSVGLKYNLFSDPYEQQLLSAGVVYEVPIGTSDAQQGNGDGTFDLFLTGGAKICCNGHWLGAGGLVLPTNDGDNSTWCYVSNHFDYYVGHCMYALMEYNWYHHIESGDNGIDGVEGGDLFNFGSTGVAGNDIVTGAFGMKYKPNCKTEVGIAWEVPLTERRDVLENRIAFDFIRRF